MLFHHEPPAEPTLDDREVNAILKALDLTCERCGTDQGVAMESSRTAYHYDPQEGGTCPTIGCDGTLEFALPSPCSCATSPMPPCGSCTGSYLECQACGEHADDHDPNRPVALCRPCATEHHEHWDGMWSDYYSGCL